MHFGKKFYFTYPYPIREFDFMCVETKREVFKSATLFFQRFLKSRNLCLFEAFLMFYYKICCKNHAFETFAEKN